MAPDIFHAIKLLPQLRKLERGNLGHFSSEHVVPFEYHQINIWHIADETVDLQNSLQDENTPAGGKLVFVGVVDNCLLTQL